MATCSKLVEIGNETRPQMIQKNPYNESNVYGIMHPNATQAKGGLDDPDNNKGKSPLSGAYLDTQNGGSHIDIYGDPSLGGSGRILTETNLYSKTKQYDCFPE